MTTILLLFLVAGLWWLRKQMVLQSEKGRRRTKMKEMERFVKRDNSGFTLVEVLVALAVLAIVSIPLLSYFTDGSRLNALSANKQKANMAAQAIMEDFKAKSMAEIATEYRNMSGDSGQYTDSTYTTKYAATEEFVPNQPDATDATIPVTPYFFQYSNYMVGDAPYDIRVKVSEGRYQWQHTVSGTAINDWNAFKNYDIGAVEANQNAVIQDGASDRESAVTALLKEYQDVVGASAQRSTVEGDMVRQMQLTVDKTGDVIKVTMWNEYSCPGITEIASVRKRVQRFEKTYSALDNIYLFFYPGNTTNHNVGTYKDQIKVELTGEYAGRNILQDVCNVYLIASSVAETYWLWEVGDQLCFQDNTLTNPLKNNVTVTNGTKRVDAIGTSGPRLNSQYYDQIEGHNQRLLDIEVSVYRKGHAGEAKYLLFTLNSAEDD